MSKQKLYKTEFIDEMAAKFGTTKTAARKIIETYNEMLEYCILNRIPIHMLGLYELSYKKHKGKKVTAFETKEVSITKDKFKPTISVAECLKKKIEDFDE